jgi:predicted DNA-binding transcriptional regulator AlpA
MQALHADEISLKDKKFAARYLGVSESKLNRWVMAGTGPRFIKIDNLVRYRIEDLAAYVESCMRGGKAAA